MSKSEVLRCTEDQRDEVLRLYSMNQENVRDIVIRLKEWMQAQPFFTDVMEDIVLAKFIVLNKLNTELVKRKVTMYYALRSSLPEIFKHNPNSPEMLKHMDLIYYFPLPNLTPDCNRVSIFHVQEHDPENFDPHLLVAYGLSIVEIRLREDVQYRDVYVYDLKNIKLGHVLKFTPTILNKARAILDALFDTSVVSIHYINAPGFVDSFLNLIKSFMKDKIRQRVFIHKDLNSLYETVPQATLPKEYGGDAGSLEEIRNSWKRKFAEYNSLFEHLSSIKVDMDLIPDKLKLNDTFGVYGNFRKLEVD